MESSWKILSVNKRNISTALYERLFSKSSDLQDLFVNKDMRSHKAIFINVLDGMISLSNLSPKIAKMRLQSLGQEHIAYEVEWVVVVIF